MELKVRKAIIPAAGLGTRLLPMTRVVPKELLPVWGKPGIQWILEEAFLGGIEEVAIIINDRKGLIRNYLSVTSPNGLQWMDDDGSFLDLLHTLKIHFILQESPLGLGDAITRARTWIGKEPFFLMLPDNLFFGEKQPLAQIHDLFQRCGKDILALVRIYYREAQGFGNSGRVKARPISERVYRIDWIENKGPGSYSLNLKEGEWGLRGFARYILMPHFFHILEEIRQEQKGMDLELDDVPALQILSKREELFGVELEGKGFDVGNHQGYLMANAWCLEKFGPPKREESP